MLKPHAASGAVAVEFAVVLPLFLIFVFGIIEFGMALYNKQVLTNASREGARAGIIARAPRPTPEEIAKVVRQYLGKAGLDADKATILVQGAGGDSGEELDIRVEYPFTFAILPHFLADVSKDIVLHARVVMLME